MNNLEELKEKLVSLFLEYNVVPQGYDVELWTLEENDRFNTRWPDKAESFETVVKRSVEDLLVL